MNDTLKNTSLSASNLSEEDCSLPVAHGVALISTNAFVSVFGTLGNLLVCVAVVTYPRLRRPSNFLLFSLAIADLLVTTICEPLFVAILCKLVFFKDCAADFEQPYVILARLSSSASIAHMAAISVDRLIAVVFPLHYRYIMESYGLKAMLIMSWTLPIVVPIYNALTPANFPKGFIGLAIFGLCYVTVFISYFLIVISLVRHRRKQNQARPRVSSDVNTFHVEVHVAFTLAIVIVVFTACWFPFVGAFFVSGKLLVKKHGLALMWIRTLALSNSAMNFLIYGSRLPSFREAFTSVGQKIIRGVFIPKCSRNHGSYNVTAMQAIS